MQFHRGIKVAANKFKRIIVALVGTAAIIAAVQVSADAAVVHRIGGHAAVADATVVPVPDGPGNGEWT
ncbi:hypothetical protein [Streptacidiphilus sp. EB129]|uniref:hypothetical protein n=1 Tax=Streptacidiphilus sp. EB129 TaxID=3156262 RepID=UPI0035133081